MGRVEEVSTWGLGWREGLHGGRKEGVSIWRQDGECLHGVRWRGCLHGYGGGSVYREVGWRECLHVGRVE